MRRFSTIFILIVVLCCTIYSASAQTATPPPIDILVPQPLRYPHDPAAYTQGLLLHDGYAYESTGLEGLSSLRRVDWRTGEVLQRFDLTRANLEAVGWLDTVIQRCTNMEGSQELFAEGLALVDDRLIQLTWRTECALVYDRETFEILDVIRYDDTPDMIDEGWGLCYDGEWLYMSDGSAALTRRDPQTFAALERITVTFRGSPLTRLNELECVGSSVYANIWQTPNIVRIDKTSGAVDGVIFVENLLTPQEAATADVLNGIAYDETRDVFLITGKLWAWLFETRFGVVDQT